MQNAIRKYESQDQQKFKDFYTSMSKKDEQKRVLNALKQHKTAKRTWQAGIVGILGLYARQRYGGFGLLIAELVVWSASVGFVWYKILIQEYENKLVKTCHAMATELDVLLQQTKSCAWVMEDEGGHGQFLGTVALKFENNEARVGYLTGLNARIRFMLVQKAIRFAKENDIQVVSKWNSDTKFTESLL